MTNQTITEILQTRELKNEKTVAIVRLILALTGIVDILSYFGIISLSETKPTRLSLLTGAYILIYSIVIFLLLLDKRYRPNLKFFVIALDYSYVFMAFLFDPVITANPATIVWYAFGGTLVFFLINLLRYSRAGTLVAMISTVVTFFTLCILTNVDSGQMIQVGIAISVVLLIGYYITSSSIRMMEEASTKQMMERYLAPQLVTELINEDTDLALGGKKQQVSILFSDIRSFTEISEGIPPERVVSILNDYLSLMTEVIYRHQGTIDKFIGDAIMTLFGAPIKKEDDTLRCVLTALDMQKALDSFNRANQDLPRKLEIGIGIHSGEAIAGNIGSEKRLDYTVIGDTVNLASRIEGLTKLYGTSILITDSSYEILLSQYDELPFLLREIDRVIVKGKSKAVTIYEIQPMDMDEILKPVYQNFSEGLKLYRSKNFTAAESLFRTNKADRASMIYAKRCEFFQKNPPKENWNGTHKMMQK